MVRDWPFEDDTPVEKSRRRRKPRRTELGLTVGQYEELLEAQGGGCAICGNPPKTRRLDVDHDHRTGAIRGLLCHVHNRVLWPGATPRVLRDMADYLAGRLPLDVIELLDEINRARHDGAR